MRSLRSLILAATISALPAGAALAADMTIYQPAPAPVPARLYDWEGAYVGLHGGWGSSSASSIYNDDAFNAPSCGPGFFWGCPVDVDPSGAFVGAQAGYNHLFSNNLLIGVEGDFSFARLTDSGDGPFDWIGGPSSTHVDLKVDRMATIQARVGWAMDRWLPFATVGWGWAHAERSAFNPDTIGPTAVSSSNWHHGWTLGAGVEYGITDHWTVKGEYRYFAGSTETYGLGFADGTAIDLDIHTFRVGANYRF